MRSEDHRNLKNCPGRAQVSERKADPDEMNVSMEHKKLFLINYRKAILQKTRFPIQLADTLLENCCIGNEAYQTIKNQKTKPEQMREIYSNLNCKKHYDCMYEWFEEYEADLLEELEQSNNDSDAPQNKKAKLENGDETDNNLTQYPGLRMFTSFPKLENWVSENSEELISKLEEKLGGKGMETLKKTLREKELKNNLVFSAEDFDNIRKNTKLKYFLEKKNEILEFPTLTYDVFFKKSPPVRKTSDNNVKKAQNGKTDWQPQCGQSGEQGHVEGQENEEVNEQDNVNSVLSELLPKNPPADNTANEGLLDTQEKHEPEENKNTSTAVKLPEETKITVLKSGENNMTTNTSTPPDPPQTIRTGRGNRQKELTDRCKRVCVWAVKNNCSEDLVDQITIQTNAEHSEYSCFKAENIWIYKHLTPQRKMFYFTKDDKSSISTETKIQYHMFVCNVKEAIVLGPTGTEYQVKYQEPSNDIKKCERFVFEVFAPALAVFKQIQKEELNSLISKYLTFPQ